MVTCLGYSEKDVGLSTFGPRCPAHCSAQPAYLDGVEVTAQDLRRPVSKDHFQHYSAEQMAWSRPKPFTPKTKMYKSENSCANWVTETKLDFRNTFQEGFRNRQPAYGEKYEQGRQQQWMQFFQSPSRKLYYSKHKGA